MIENLDQNVGRMMQFLKDAGLDGDTAVVFLSDHGELDGCHGLQSKQQPYEESAGIPLIIMDPTAAYAAGRAVDAPVATEDLFPTLLGLVGLSPKNTLPGADVSPLVRDGDAQLDRDGVLMEFVSEIRPGGLFHEKTWRGWRTKRYKYTVIGDLHGAEPWQFYDLEADPYELNNRIDDPGYAELAAAHHHALRNRLIETVDPFPLKPAFGCDGLNQY